MAAQDRVLAQGYRTADLSPQGEEILVNTEQLIQLLLEEIYNLYNLQNLEIEVLHESYQ
jgi:3-isopropylmalate dehydrogenase/3-benzylmalate dehydrogenase